MLFALTFVSNFILLPDLENTDIIIINVNTQKQFHNSSLYLVSYPEMQVAIVKLFCETMKHSEVNLVNT